jgi:hypothetical protein
LTLGVSIAVDYVYGRRKRYIKIQRGLTSMDVTTDDIRDSEVLPKLLKDVSMNRDVAEAFMDGSYDTRGSYIILRRMGVRPVIKPRANARTDRGLQRGEYQQLYSRCLGREGGVG